MFFLLFFPDSKLWFKVIFQREFPPFCSSLVFSPGFSSLIFIASMVLSFSTVRQSSRTFHSRSLVEPLHSTIWRITCESFLWWSDVVVTCQLVCSTKMDLQPIHFISDKKWISGLYRKMILVWGGMILIFRVTKTTCKSHSFFNLHAKFCVKLPLYCRKIVGKILVHNFHLHKVVKNVEKTIYTKYRKPFIPFKQSWKK